MRFFVVCVTGSALVFRPELTRAFSAAPLIVKEGSGPLLTDDQIKAAAGKIIVYHGAADGAFSLFRAGVDKSTAAVCVDGVCQLPVTTAEDLRRTIAKPSMVSRTIGSKIVSTSGS